MESSAAADTSINRPPIIRFPQISLPCQNTLTISVDVNPVKHAVGEILSRRLVVFVAVDRSDGLWGDTVASACAAASGRTLGEELRPHLYDVEELVPIDAAVSVHVVEFEVPAQFVLHLSSHHQAESGDVLHEVYVAVLQKREVLLNQTHARIIVQHTETRSGTKDYLQAQSENRQLSLHQSIVSDNLPV